MEKIETPKVKAKAKQAPKVLEKKTPKKAPLKKPVEVPKTNDEVLSVDIMDIPDIKEKEPALILTPEQMEEKRVENHYAALGKIDYYHKHIKGK